MSHKVGEKPVAYELDCFTTQSGRVLAVTYEKTWPGSISPYLCKCHIPLAKEKLYVNVPVPLISPPGHRVMFMP